MFRRFLFATLNRRTHDSPAEHNAAQDGDDSVMFVFVCTTLLLLLAQPQPAKLLCGGGCKQRMNENDIREKGE